MPRLINQIYVDATEKNINMSHLITPEILFSYSKEVWVLGQDTLREKLE